MKNMLMLSAAVVLVAATSEAKTGVYAGGQLGFMKQTMAMSGTTGRLETEDNAGQIKKKRSKLTGGVFVGYEHALTDDLILAAELAVNTSSSKVGLEFEDEDENGVHAFAKRRMDVNPAVFLKYKVQDTFVPYIKCGLDIAKYQVRMVSYRDDAAENRLVDTKKNMTLVRVTPGIGIESALSDSVSVRGEYSYAMGTKKKSLSRRVGALQTFKTDYVLKGVQFVKVGAFYKF